MGAPMGQDGFCLAINISLNPSFSYMLGFGETRIGFGSFCGVEIQEVNDLQTLLRVTLASYCNKPANISLASKAKYCTGDILDRKKIEKEWDCEWSKECKLYEFS